MILMIYKLIRWGPTHPSMDYFYIKTHPDWVDLCKFGYVEANERPIHNRIHYSIEEHPEHFVFLHVIVFEKGADYNVHLDKTITRATYRPENVEHPLLCELHSYLVSSKTARKKATECIRLQGVSCLLRVVREVFPSAGLRIVKEYSSEELHHFGESD